MKRGWFNDSFRHGLAARGIRTKNSVYFKTKEEEPVPSWLKTLPKKDSAPPPSSPEMVVVPKRRLPSEKQIRANISNLAISSALQREEKKPASPEMIEAAKGEQVELQEAIDKVNNLSAKKSLRIAKLFEKDPEEKPMFDMDAFKKIEKARKIDEQFQREVDDLLKGYENRFDYIYDNEEIARARKRDEIFLRSLEQAQADLKDRLKRKKVKLEKELVGLQTEAGLAPEVTIDKGQVVEQEEGITRIGVRGQGAVERQIRKKQSELDRINEELGMEAGDFSRGTGVDWLTNVASSIRKKGKSSVSPADIKRVFYEIEEPVDQRNVLIKFKRAFAENKEADPYKKKLERSLDINLDEVQE